MRNLLVILLLFLVACATNVQPQPQVNIYAKQVGLQDIDTTSAWAYHTVVYFPNGDSTKFSQIHTVTDTSTIGGKTAYKVEVSTPFGSYDYKMRTDSTGVTIEKGGVINHYQYPAQDTFTINASCGLLSVICSNDTSINIGDKSFQDVTAYHIWEQPCSSTNTYSFYKYGIGLVATISQSGNEVTYQYLVQVQ